MIFFAENVQTLAKNGGHEPHVKELLILEKSDIMFAENTFYGGFTIFGIKF